MTKTKSYLVLVMLSMVALLMGACAAETSPSPDLEVKDAAEARDAALSYLREHEPHNAPSADIKWQEQDVAPPGLVGVANKWFASEEWAVAISYPVVLPENTVYQVMVSSLKLGWHWKGSVKADGTVTELSAFKQMTEEESQKTAEEFLKNSPTFTYDGIEDTLRLADTLTARCPYCWVFIYEFDSRHAGYGDRTGQVLAQVITHHRTVISVEQLQITSAIMDEEWDMIRQEAVGEQEKSEGVSLNISRDDFMKLRHISKEVEVAVGDSLTIALCSNPTTGFKWEQETIGQIILELIKSKYEPSKEAKQEPPVPGAGGKEIWTFKALKKGTTELRMEYSQPWEGGTKVEWEFNLTVVVK